MWPLLVLREVNGEVIIRRTKVKGDRGGFRGVRGNGFGPSKCQNSYAAHDKEKQSVHQMLSQNFFKNILH